MNFIKAYKYPLSITLGLIAVFFIFQNGTCSSGSSSDTSTATATSATSVLTVTPSTVTLVAGGTQQFSVSGGSGNYTYSTIGGGTITSDGYFVAPSSGSVEVAVLDTTSNLYGYALVTIGTTTGTTTSTVQTVTLVAASTSIAAGATVVLTASGGTAPYTFYLESGTGGFPDVTTISSSTGAIVYTAPANTTTAEIYATDVYSNVSGTVDITVGSGSGTTTASSPEILSVSTNSQYVATGVNHSVNLLINHNLTDFYSSLEYGNVTPTTSPYVMLNLGDSSTGTAGFVTVDHINLTARVASAKMLCFPSMYTIKAQNADGSWTTIGTFTTQPDFDAVARITFTAVTTNKLAIVATSLTKDNNGNLYFQLAEAGF
jgi:hypothetical protein